MCKKIDWLYVVFSLRGDQFLVERMINAMMWCNDVMRWCDAIVLCIRFDVGMSRLLHLWYVMNRGKTFTGVSYDVQKKYCYSLYYIQNGYILKYWMYIYQKIDALSTNENTTTSNSQREVCDACWMWEQIFISFFLGRHLRSDRAYRRKYSANIIRETSEAS